MASVLPRIHSIALRPPEYEHWVDNTQSVFPAWSAHPEAWGAAIEYLRTRPRPVGSTLIHGDFQHFNLLWRRGRLSGVVDWAFSGTGPPDVDVAHCRLNLAVLFSADWAERFRRMYEAEAGRRLEPWFDLTNGAFGYSHDWKEFIPTQVGGRANVDLAGMDGRIDDLLLASLARC